MKDERVYFPGLNGIRAIAAFIVMVFHTDQWSTYFGLEPYGFWNTRMQTYAVVLFFVLSGFLITYLLLKEKNRYGEINYRKFYIRRILRIWPLYYTVLFAGLLLLVLLPHLTDPLTKQDLSITAILYTILLPNIAFYLGYSPDLIGILWSVGVEEQFYAFWPFLINRSKNILKSLLIFLAVYLVIKVIVGLGMFSFLPFDLNGLFFFLPFDCMAIGGVFAYLLYSGSRWLRLVYHPFVQVIAWLFLLISIFKSPIQFPFLQGLHREYHAVVYAILIVNVSSNPKTLITLENRVFNFLGRISYGIYVYHFIILFLLSLSLKKYLSLVPSNLAHIIMFSGEVCITVLVSYMSYTYFEAWFLRKKNNYMLIKSGGVNSEVLIDSNVEA